MKTNNSIIQLLVIVIAAIAGAVTMPDQGKDTAAVAGKNDSAIVSPQAPSVAIDTTKKTRDTMRIVTPVIQLKTQKDTVLLITDKDEIAKIVSSISGKVRKSRIQGYGGAGGFGPRFAAFDMGPITELAQNSDGIHFPTLGAGYSVVTMNGGLGYGGLGNGMRIGGGGWGGSRKYTSNQFRRSGAPEDSVALLSVNVSYGGFLIEKVFVVDNWNIIAGGMIGGGGFSATRTVKPAKGASAFSASSGDFGKPNLSAALGTLELHGGATYTVVPWLHIGGDASMMFYESINGFDIPAGRSFYGVMPSFGFRIIFGNLG